MRKQQSQYDSFGEMDEHDAPTDPVMPVFLPPSSATIADEVIPAPKPNERPFPYQDVPFVAPSNSPYNQPQPSVYPVLPPAPGSSKGGKLPPGGAVPTYPILPERPAQTASPQTQTRRSSFPIFVGMLFVAVQLLLLVRFVLKLLVLPGNTTWISIIYTVSDVFVQPFRMLMQNFALPMPNGLELYTLVAILVYGLLSRLLVRFLKALLHSR